jgi:hypothetical protein
LIHYAENDAYPEWVYQLSLTRRSLSELPITETELRLIAALAIIGDSKSPKNG